MNKTMRNTRQKQIIKKILCSTSSHPTADWIYEQARIQLPNISLGTVYRNLSLMKQSGEILELNYGSGFSRFDGNPNPHYHFRCCKCTNVYDIEVKLENKLETLVSLEGYEVHGHRLEFIGLCPNCQGKNIIV